MHNNFMRHFVFKAYSKAEMVKKEKKRKIDFSVCWKVDRVLLFQDLAAYWKWTLPLLCFNCSVDFVTEDCK